MAADRLRSVNGFWMKFTPDDIAGIPGHEEHLHVRPSASQHIVELPPVHLRHHDVGEEQVDMVAIRFRDGTTAIRIFRRGHAIAKAFEHPAGEGPHFLVVLHHEDALIPAQNTV